MDRRQIAAVLALERLSIPLRLDTFEYRLLAQKVLYLAQAGGLGIGYPYSWYLRGPYSSALTRDLFASQADPASMEDVTQNWKLDDNAGERLDRIRKLLQPPKGIRLWDWSELLASVHFLIDRKQAAQDTEEIERRLRAFGKNFSRREVEDAFECLKEYSLLR